MAFMAYFTYKDNHLLAEKILFKGKYHIDTTRLKDWDYSSCGYYYVTICTKDKVCLFGEVIKSSEGLGASVKLSQIGEIVENFWRGIPEYYNNIELDECIMMPNHIHGIIAITEERKNITLGHIINQFKGLCTKNIREFGNRNFTWQPRFHDHIIRGEKDLERIRQYIYENPLKWLLGEGEDW